MIFFPLKYFVNLNAPSFNIKSICNFVSLSLFFIIFIALFISTVNNSFILSFSSLLINSSSLNFVPKIYPKYEVLLYFFSSIFFVVNISSKTLLDHIYKSFISVTSNILYNWFNSFSVIVSVFLFSLYIK